MRIAMLLTVYKEEKAIAECIEWHKTYVDEIILIHDGPRVDDTIPIATSLGARCYETAERRGYCEPVREEARRQALLHSCDWGIVVDPDERWSLPLLKVLRQLADAADLQQTGLYVINRITYFLPEDAHPTMTNDPQARFFRLSMGRFSDIIHTNVTVRRGGIIDLTHLTETHHIKHWNVMADFVEKGERYSRIARDLLKQYADNPLAVKHLRACITQGGVITE